MIDYENGYFGKNFNSFSVLGNTLTNGDKGVSISARIGYNVRNNKYLFWKFCRAIVDTTFYPVEGWGHCERAYQNQLCNAYTVHGSVIGLVFMSLLMLVVCILLSVLFWGWHGISKLIQKLK